MQIKSINLKVNFKYAISKKKIMITSIDAKIRSSWQVPDFKVLYWQGKQQNFCVVIPVINEGDNIINFLHRLAALEINKISDVIIVDGGSHDNSLVIERIKSFGVKGLW